jgi:large repetitive protein
MSDGLRSAGKIPLAQPYSSMTFTGNSPTSAYNGTETVAPSVFAVSTGDTAIVDWVLVEIRLGAANNAVVITNRAGLLRRDGKIVDVDGYSPLRFGDLVSMGGANDYLLNGNYHVAVRHRLTLGTRTSSLVTITQSSAITPVFTTIDFTTTTNALANSRKLLSNGKYALYMGDTDRSGTISSQDVSNVRARNPTTTTFFDYAFGYDLDFTATIFSSDVSIVRGNSLLFQVNLNQ